jgi:hypothetical protein
MKMMGVLCTSYTSHQAAVHHTLLHLKDDEDDMDVDDEMGRRSSGKLKRKTFSQVSAGRVASSMVS